MTKVKIAINRLGSKGRLESEIESRYDICPAIDSSNKIDSCKTRKRKRVFLDSTIYSSNTRGIKRAMDKIKTIDFVAFNPALAAFEGLETIDKEDTLQILGVTEKELEEVLMTFATAITKTRTNIVYVGAGGSVINFLSWRMKFMSFYTNRKIKLNSHRIYIYDDDTLALSNLPRLPIDITSSMYKHLHKYESMEQDVVPVSKIYKADIAYIVSYFGGDNNVQPITERVTQDVVDEFMIENTLYIGAPDLRTRRMISSNSRPGLNFISITHSGDKARISANTEIDNELMIETYGKIDLNRFFANQIFMSYKLMEAIGNKYKESSGNNIDFGKEEEIFIGKSDELIEKPIDNSEEKTFWMNEKKRVIIL